MSVDLLAAPTTVFDDRSQKLLADAHFLFPEARRRRRRRVLTAWIAGATLAVGLTVFVIGGSGRFHGGPPLTATGRGPSSGPVVHQRSPAGHGPSSGGPAVCGPAPVVRPGTKESASLLPCYKAQNLPPALFHVASP